ncbi:MAG: hypothetical protein AAFR17_08995 [Pseudomonadota bacterium]
MFNLTFRAVGLYCYFEDLEIDGDPTQTVKEVMDKVKALQPAFDYVQAPGKAIIQSMSYDFSDSSNGPPNAMPKDKIGRGMRNEASQLGDIARIWQYYREVVVEKDGEEYPIRIRSKGQPPFSMQPLNKDEKVPPGFAIKRYNLVWRLVRLELTPEAEQALKIAYAG